MMDNDPAVTDKEAAILRRIKQNRERPEDAPPEPTKDAVERLAWQLAIADNKHFPRPDDFDSPRKLQAVARHVLQQGEFVHVRGG